jgi:hypothetical protein
VAFVGIFILSCLVGLFVIAVFKHTRLMLTLIAIPVIGFIVIMAAAIIYSLAIGR